ncbi:hypothetical protein A2U01_0057598, partial [Trifolium medium]|nr:hypothetical protein [Trifolium medium]
VNTDIGSCELSISETQLESRKATREDGGVEVEQEKEQVPCSKLCSDTILNFSVHH